MPVNSVPTVQDYVLTGVLATQREIGMSGYTSGRIINNSGAAVVLTVYESDKAQGEYVVCTDAGTSGALSSLGDGESVALPSVCAGSAFLKLLPADTAGGTIQVVKK